MVTEIEIFERDPSELDESDLGRVEDQAVVSSSDWTAETIVALMRRGNIDLSPFWQRREAWTDDRKSKYIESLFLGLPVPQIVLAERRGQRGSYIVIDGKQRLLALRRFAVETDDDDFRPLTLSRLDQIPELSGLSWVGIKSDPNLERHKDVFDNQPIRTVVVRNYPTDAFLYLLFLRLNTGSVPLSTQELRQALHPGPFTDFVVSFSAESQSIQRTLGIDAPDFRMRDVELLVRYFAFAESIPVYRGNLKEFLDNASLQLNRTWNSREAEIKAMARGCEESIDATITIFQDNAFKRWRGGDGYIGRFNRAVFDIMTYYFRHADLRNNAIEQRHQVVRGFQLLCDSDLTFSEALQTTTKSRVATFHRFRSWGQCLQEVLGCEVPIPEPLN